jgi:hypothetical protein
MKSLFLAWQAPPDLAHGRAWFPVGLLDAEPEISRYRFRYTHGAKVAREKVGFNPLLAFPSLDKSYDSSELFPLFKNRVLSSKRTDFPEYIQWLDLDQKSSDPIAILSVSGGERMTDNLEVFPKVTTDVDGNFQVRFFLHGIRHLGEKAIERAAQLKVGDTLRILIELNNPATNLAVALLTEDYQPIGWAPRYLVEDLIKCAPNSPVMSAKIARINMDGAPLNQRYLIDYTGHAPQDWQPMSTPDFEPLLA